MIRILALGETNVLEHTAELQAEEPSITKAYTALSAYAFRTLIAPHQRGLDIAENAEYINGVAGEIYGMCSEMFKIYKSELKARPVLVQKMRESAQGATQVNFAGKKAATDAKKAAENIQNGIEDDRSWEDLRAAYNRVVYYHCSANTLLVVGGIKGYSGTITVCQKGRNPLRTNSDKHSIEVMYMA
ncbi:hypothetical protein MMC14_005957 [Varicellaria rhodocarpa]|nr:hypothetical protein [Varicellaria rhodocarpa]